MIDDCYIESASIIPAGPVLLEGTGVEAGGSLCSRLYRNEEFQGVGEGEVFARKYTTTLNNIPDYVFDPSYELMPLSDLGTYVTKEHHLPNVPSAEEYTSAPVDLGEMNRLLLEKV